jgi:hypothetical protein
MSAPATPARRVRTAVLAGAAALAPLLAAPALAHHSGSMFDSAVQTPLAGTVREFKWSNPHAWIELDVAAEDGTTTMWAIEMQPPNMLVRRGWTRRSINPGDAVSVTINPLRDGQPGGSFVSVTLADGTVLID